MAMEIYPSLDPDRSCDHLSSVTVRNVWLVFSDGGECLTTCWLKRGCRCNVNQVLPSRSFCLLGTCVQKCRSSPDRCTDPRNLYCHTHDTADRWPSLLLAASCAARHRRSWLEQGFAIIIGKKISCGVNRWQIIRLCSGTLGNKRRKLSAWYRISFETLLFTLLVKNIVVLRTYVSSFWIQTFFFGPYYQPV